MSGSKIRLLILLTLTHCIRAAPYQDYARRVARSDDPVLGLEAVVQQQAQALQEMQTRLSALENKEPNSFKPVAFTVHFSGGDSADGIALGSHQILQFDSVVTNIGNGYNPSTGIFTAPVAGTYVFFLTLMSADAHARIYLAIDKHGTLLDRAFAEGRGDSLDQGSSLVTTHLAAGEQLWVREHAGDAVRGVDWTVFSGFLIQAD